MPVVEETLELIEELVDGADITVKAVSLGLFYAGVSIESTSGSHGGVAYVFRDNPSCKPLETSGEYHEMDAVSLAKLSLSSSLAEASIGVASMNALSQLIVEENRERYRPVSIDVADLVKEGENVAMVGYMGPVIGKLVEKGCRVNVVEMRQVENPVVPVVQPDLMEDTLKEADVVIVTGSSLVNRTIDEILDMSIAPRVFAVAGPTASIIPDVLFDHGVTAVMGVTVTDPEEMIKVVSQGGGTRRLIARCAKKRACLSNFFKSK